MTGFVSSTSCLSSTPGGDDPCDGTGVDPCGDGGIGVCLTGRSLNFKVSTEGKGAVGEVGRRGGPSSLSPDNE